MTRTWTIARAGLRTGVIAGMIALAAGCSSSSGAGSSASSTSMTEPTSLSATSPAPGLASASAGPLVITGGYIPAPASPDVAAAYLTIANNSETADKLQKVTSSVTSMVTAMNETDSGGIGSMTDLTDLTIPAHGTMQFVPNHAHLMLENPKPLQVGNEVALTLTFMHAGTVQITVPVIPLTGIPTTVSTQMTMSNAPNDSMSMSPSDG
jgi:hypothetical protein